MPRVRACSTVPMTTSGKTPAPSNSVRRAGALTNIVDNLEESDFLTPAIVDRDPVTIAIGTEGAPLPC